MPVLIPREVQAWLARFVESGRLKKDGTRQQDLYFL